VQLLPPPHVVAQQHHLARVLRLLRARPLCVSKRVEQRRGAGVRKRLSQKAAETGARTKKAESSWKREHFWQKRMGVPAKSHACARRCAMHSLHGAAWVVGTLLVSATGHERAPDPKPHMGRRDAVAWRALARACCAATRL
jgi:hypothetical protein